MSRIIDLSHEISPNMSVYPSDPAVSFDRHCDYENGYRVHIVSFGTHTGTHIDVPAHKIKGSKAVDEVGISKFAARAYVMDLTDLKPLEEITAAHLTKVEEKLAGVRAILFKTNWSDHYGLSDFFSDYSGLSEDAAYWLCAHGIETIAMESPSVSVKNGERIHTILLENEIGIVESLANVKEIQSEYVQFFAVPLKLKGLDGSPVRAFAIEE